MDSPLTWLVIILVFIAIIIICSTIKIVPQAHAYVIERLGTYCGTWSVGLHMKMPIIDKIARRVTLKEQVVDFAPQPVITKDNHCKFPSLAFTFWKVNTLVRLVPVFSILPL